MQKIGSKRKKWDSKGKSGIQKERVDMEFEAQKKLNIKLLHLHLIRLFTVAILGPFSAHFCAFGRETKLNK